MYEPEIVGAKLARRNIIITSHGESKRVSIHALRAGYHAGSVPPDTDVLVTDTRADGEVYCGEGTVASVVEADGRFDVVDCTRAQPATRDL